jgi:hypothetical protein
VHTPNVAAAVARATAVIVAAAVAMSVVPGYATARPDCDRPDPPPICSTGGGGEDPPPQSNVIGFLDAVGPGDGGVRVSGWAIDPDTREPITVRITIDGAPAAEARADVNRPDVAAAHPAAGPAHGFDLVLPRPTNGRWQVCATGIDVQTRGATLLGCRAYAEVRHPPSPVEELTVLTANLQGTDSSVVDWRIRHGRIATWITSTRIVPDLLVLQEVPGSKCYFAGGCSPRDYEVLFGLIHAVRDGTGVTYRIAHLSTEYIAEGINPLQQGRAVLYNPQRLRNTTLGAWGPAPFDAPLGEDPQTRHSHPCKSPPPAWSADCGLVDGGLGVHWAAKGISFGRFELHERPGLPIDVYDMHAWNHDDPGISFTTLVQRLMPTVPAAADRLYPPIVAGDFNAGPSDLRNELAPGGKLEPLELAKLVDDPDRMAVVTGERGAYPAVRGIAVSEARVLPDVVPPAPNAPCGPEEPKWSDHCAVFVRLAPQS